MKKFLMLLFVICFAFSSCGKKEEGKKEPVKEETFKDLKYGSEMIITDWTVGNSLENSKGGIALSMMIMINDKDTSLYDVCKEKFMNKYPMQIDVEPNSKSNRAMVLLPNYLTVSVSGMGTTSGGLKEFDNPEMLKKLLPLFDLDGLSKLPMGNLKGNDLIKFMPIFEIKK